MADLGSPSNVLSSDPDAVRIDGILEDVETKVVPAVIVDENDGVGGDSTEGDIQVTTIDMRSPRQRTLDYANSVYAESEGSYWSWLDTHQESQVQIEELSGHLLGAQEAMRNISDVLIFKAPFKEHDLRMAWLRTELNQREDTLRLQNDIREFTRRLNMHKRIISTCELYMAYYQQRMTFSSATISSLPMDLGSPVNP